MDKDAIEFAQRKEIIANKLSQREHLEKDFDRAPADERSDYMRDYARVLYASSFRRLQGKMQIFPIEDGKFNRNRLTHSLEVAQLARSIATALQLTHPVVAETASLIHDIGNPPFGHYGENILDELAQPVGGYEGNAQAFRIMRSLEKKHPSFDGLNLTNRILWGITKYFFNREKNKKKFLYDEDFDYLKLILNRAEITDTKSIDAQIMDLADEIAYAAHDLEDAIRAGMIAIDELIYEFSRSEKYSNMAVPFNEIVQAAKSFAKKPGTLGTSEEFSIIFIKELTSRLVNTLVNDIGLIYNKETKQYEMGYKKLKNLADGLKKLVFSTILKKTKIQEYERHGEKVIRGLFEVYSDEIFNKNLIFLPPELRKIQKYKKERLICDYISGMMDQFAIQEYIRFYGKSKYEALYIEPKKMAPTKMDECQP